VRATEAQPQAAGFVPRLVGADGQPQFGWQLRTLPRLDQLLRQAFFLPGPSGPRREPAAGVVIEQPAAAALLVSRDVLRALGGFDEGFFPAWFEDVDFARRLRATGGTLVYWPAAAVTHRLGGSVGVLGYRGFLLAYGRNLQRYVAKHHGALAAGSLRILIPLGALLRLLALPLRRPQRAASRATAAAALWALAGAALTGFPESAR
jgi:GT2 family glycosyltransferase